ncbi:ADP-ribose glycohydrolase OARD1 [Peromyscus leucopus]|uniref:ADP-ribose glycohydrolase OARD1 n=1 Tax=Peromyscus leucopus TaxID=10041 RepID=UPI0018859881|nr:ADP-ribose glycohydrolase OARD1 [Peromyscus leucopus]
MGLDSKPHSCKDLFSLGIGFESEGVCKTLLTVEVWRPGEKKSGEVAVLKRDGRYIYYLITKKRASHKPTYENLRKSLEAMKSHCLKNGVTDLSMPRIGCGLDRLQWENVSAIIEEVFEATDIKITVYTL